MAQRTALLRKRRQLTGARFSSLLLPRSQCRVVPECDDEPSSFVPRENPSTSSDAFLFEEQRTAIAVLPFFPQEYLSSSLDAALSDQQDPANSVLSEANMSTSSGAPRSSQGLCNDDARAFDEIRISITEASGTRAATKVIDVKEKPPPGVTKFGSGTGFCQSPNCIGCKLRRIERQQRELDDSAR